MDCNLRCTYCFYETPGRVNSGNLFPIGLLRSLFFQLPEVNDQEDLRVIWHGGEPTLAGLSYFREALKIQRSVEEQYGCTFRNSIQTNGVLVDEDWVEFFKENGFRVGISVDGPPAIHNRYRKTPGGSGSFEQVIKGLKLCLQAKLPLGCLATINESHGGDGRQLFQFFVGLGVKNFRAKPCYEVDSRTGEPLPFSTSPRAYGTFLVELFDAWIEKDDPAINCGPVDDFLRGVLGQKKQQCVFKRSCHFFGVWPDGLVYPCETRGFLRKRV
ncbi:MAG: radical SAM protein [Patescibacteria group bacterium]|nr:radical SAM protein [Patescibacteria group bacterium]